MRLRHLNNLIILIFFGAICAACAAPAMSSADSSAEYAIADADTSESEQAADDSAANLADTRKIIANANVSLVVSDTEAAVEGIETLASDVGGYLADVQLSKDRYGETEVLRGSLTLRVPGRQPGRRDGPLAGVGHGCTQSECQPTRRNRPVQ